MFKYQIIIFLILLSFFSFAQENEKGVPFIRNYTTDEYDASEQNWSIVQDKRGVMYFGNNDDGVLEYDGNSWRKIPVSNKSIIRSLAVDEIGTIYVGAVGEFGLLAPDKTGDMLYNSLTSKLDSANLGFSDILNIYCEKEHVYFCSPGIIFKYNKSKKTIKTIYTSMYNFMSFVVEDNIFSGDYVLGLLKYNIDKDTMLSVIGGDYFMYKNITSFTKQNDSICLVGTYSNGAYKYNLHSGAIDSNAVETCVNNDFKNNLLYNTQQIDNNCFSFSTVQGGGNIITNKNGEIKYKIDKSKGLFDEQIAYTYQTHQKDQPLWLGLGNGISKVSINLPFTLLNSNFGLEGAVISIIKYKGVLYVGTLNGLFYLQETKDGSPRFIQIEGLVVTWKLVAYEYGGELKLFAGTSEGLFEIVDTNKVKSVEKSVTDIDSKERRYNVDNIYQPRSLPNQLMIASNGSIVVLNYLPEDKWESLYKVKNIDDDIRTIVEDDYRNIWIGTNYSGIMKFSMDDTTRTITRYSVDHGLKDKRSDVFLFNGELCFSDNKGLYQFNPEEEKFLPNTKFGKQYNDSYGVIPISGNNSNQKDIWFSLSQSNPKKSWIEHVIIEKDSVRIDSVPFKILPNVIVDFVYEDDEKNVWIGNSKGVYCYNPDFEKDYNSKFYTLIRKVIVGMDSIVFNGAYYKIDLDKDSLLIVNNTQPENLKAILEYSDNNVLFQYAAPAFDAEEHIVYSTLLEGYKELDWSKWSSKSERVFTNLKEGDYVFKVKAKDIYGVEGEVARFEFTILPPWYRTIWAYIGYVIAFIVTVYIIIKIYTRRLEQEKIRLEGIVRERTAEVVKQKEDIEKQNEVLAQQKNEIERQKDLVTEQKDHIEQIHHELKDSIHYAERIQKAILPHQDFAEQIMGDHFILFKPKDIVSGDFYFANKINDNLLFAAADCTGHGVPGAFMSMLGVAFLNEIVNDEKITKSGEVIDALRQNIIKSLQQKGETGEQKDGMDLSFCAINQKDGVVQWTGANNPLYLVRKSDSEEETLRYLNNEEEIILEPSISGYGYNLYDLKPDKMPVAIYIKMDNFSNNIIELKKGDTLYVFSDGFADQFGGPKGKKYKYKPFKELILSLQDKPMSEHKPAIDESIEAWKAHIDPTTEDVYEQVDDIVVIGYRY